MGGRDFLAGGTVSARALSKGRPAVFKRTGGQSGCSRGREGRMARTEMEEARWHGASEILIDILAFIQNFGEPLEVFEPRGDIRFTF